MNLETALTTIVTIVGGGTIVNIGYNEIKKAGKITLNSCNVIFHYRNFYTLYELLNSLELDLSFINNSGYSKIIKDIHVMFSSGKGDYGLAIENYNTPPNASLNPKSTEVLKYKLNPYLPSIQFSVDDLALGKGYLDVFYTIGKKQFTKRINSSDFNYVKQEFAG